MRFAIRFVVPCTLALAGSAGCGDDPAGGAVDASASIDASGPTVDGAPGSGCAEADTFLDLTGAPGAGAGYEAPELAVSCTDETFTVTGNGMPPYTFVAVTPNALLAHDYAYTLPRAPVRAAATTDVDTTFGIIGVAVNGMSIYAAMEGAQPAAEAFGDPIYNGITDGCTGHTSQVEYHYHALSQQCLDQANLVAQPWLSTPPSGDQRSPVLAYVFDGFPVYGPYECTDASCATVVEMLSSWDQIADPTTDAWQAYAYAAKAGVQYLDRCNGHTGPDGDYHYHATRGFPYTIGCFSGTPSMLGGGGGGGGVPTCTPGQTMCCGDDVCGGPETATNCPADCG